ncbi:MAG: hypothetical protein ABR499_01060 [Gemmatimonadaceae bacterium]
MHNQLSPQDAENDDKFMRTVETPVPITEPVYNTCRNELVVLRGTRKTRMRLETEPLGSPKLKLEGWKDTRAIYGEAIVPEGYWDDDEQTRKKRKRIVRYHNQQTLLDKFETGPVDRLPFRSVFETRTHLRRDGADPRRRVFNAGDDLFVYVQQTVEVDQNGKVRTENVFRTECN